MDDHSEEWRPVVGLEGEFEVSSLGRIRRLYAGGAEGWRIMKATPHRGGSNDPTRKYLIVNLTREGHRATGRRHQPGDKRYSKGVQRAVHLVVLEAFKGPRPSPDHQGLHGDSNPQNNRIDNLRWGTWEENCEDMRIAGTRKGERNGRSKLTSEQVVELRKIATQDDRPTWDELGLRFGVSGNQARNVGLSLAGGWAHHT